MKKWRAKWILLGCVFSLYSIGVTGGKESTGGSLSRYELIQGIQETSEKLYFPGIIYEEKEPLSVKERILQKALEIAPLGGYMAAREYSGQEVEDEATSELFLALQEMEQGEETKLERVTKAEISIDKLKNFEYLISKFYTVDSVTYVKESDFNIEEMLNQDLSVEKSAGPKILIFHTHSQEMFSDSEEQDNATIVDVGEYLTKLLNETYGIETLHHRGVYDKIDGKLDRSKAYEFARPAIEKILKENPSIEVVIDLHRDGVGKNTHLVTEVNGKQTAQIMFFNGMCRTRTNGELNGLGNPYLGTNLAFSLQMKVAAEEQFPGFTRRNYLKGYKYNMDMAPKMLLIEAGAQTNTVEEVKNSMEPLAELLNQVVGY